MMRVSAAFLFTILTSSAAFAGSWALDYSVDSYKEARQQVQQQPHKHVLVYYATTSR